MADVASTLAAWSNTTASNTPTDTTAIGSGLAGNLREIQGVITRGLSHKGSDIASAATTDLGGTEGLAHDITGTTTITSFGSGRAGLLKLLQFDGALTLTHNGTSLVLPGGANITTAAGDVAIMFSEGSGNWRCYAYVRTAAQPVQAASDTVAGVIEYAVQSEMETGTSTTLAVTPGRQAYHPGHPKFWSFCTVTGGTPVAASSFNVSGVVDDGPGLLTVTINTDFSGTTWCGGVSAGGIGSASTTYSTGIESQAAGTIQVLFQRSDGTDTDPNTWSVWGWGDQ